MHANGTPLRFMFSGGNASDINYAQPLLEGVHVPTLRGRPRKRCKWLLADKGYDSEALRQYCDRYRMQPVIPLRRMKRKPRPGLPRLFDKPKYAQRNIIERMFGWVKENRRIGTRYDKLARSFSAMVSLACSLRCLRQLISYRAYDYVELPFPLLKRIAAWQEDFDLNERPYDDSGSASDEWWDQHELEAIELAKDLQAVVAPTVVQLWRLEGWTSIDQIIRTKSSDS